MTHYESATRTWTAAGCQRRRVGTDLKLFVTHFFQDDVSKKKNDEASASSCLFTALAVAYCNIEPYESPSTVST